MSDVPPEKELADQTLLDAAARAATGDAEDAKSARPLLRRVLVSVLLIGALSAIYHRELSLGWRTLAADRHTDRADASLLAGDYGGAVQAVDEALSWLPDDPALVYLRAQVHAQAADWPAALADYSRLVDDLAPEFASAYVRRAMVYHELGDCERALEDLNRAIELGTSDHSGLLNDRAYFRALANRDIDAALADIRLAIESSPGDDPPAAFLDTRGYIHYRRGDLSAARRDLERAIELQEQERDRLREAIAQGRHASGYLLRQFDRARGEMIYHRGLVRLASGDDDAAEEDFQLAHALGFRGRAEVND